LPIFWQKPKKSRPSCSDQKIENNGQWMAYIMEVQLNGLEAINHYNGWSMAFVGASIVFTGLVALSVTIAQFKKIIDFWENTVLKKNGENETQATGSETPKIGIQLPAEWPEDVHEAANLYKPLFTKLGGTFQLADLYKLSGENDYPHPHLTIKNMREAQIIIPAGDGNFSVNQ